MRKTLFWMMMALLLVMTAKSANAACSAYPYTLTNGQVADANQVMANFNNILSCVNTGLANAPINSNITQMTGLTTPLSTTQGGTGLNATSVSSIFTTNSGGTPQWSAITASSVVTTNGSKVLTYTSASGVLDLIGSGQGDILYRGAGAWAVLAPGTSGQVLTSNGTAAPSWTAVASSHGQLLGVQVFTSNGTWTKPTGTSAIYVIVQGGGGGGAGVTAPGSGNAQAGGGGSGGAEAESYLTSVPATASVTVGAAGAGGPGAGSNGGQSSFAGTVVAPGGTGAPVVVGTGASTHINQGAPATGGATGQVAAGGQAGIFGVSTGGNEAAGGVGGASHFGGGGLGGYRTSAGATAGAVGTGAGAGGGGAAALASGAASGAPGTSGVVIVYAYN